MLPHTTHNHTQSSRIQQFGNIIVSRSASNIGPEDYCGILHTLRKATIATKVAVIEECFPLWLNLIDSFNKKYQLRFFKTLDDKESLVIPQVGALFMKAILAVDRDRQRQLWWAIGPQLENFVEWWKEQATAR